MEQSQKKEDQVNWDNLEEFNSELPTGYELAYRGRQGFTQKAKEFLKGYWINVVNANEAREDIKNDREAGLDYRTTQEYLGKYERMQWAGIGKLVEMRMIKKAA